MLDPVITEKEASRRREFLFRFFGAIAKSYAPGSKVRIESLWLNQLARHIREFPSIYGHCDRTQSETKAFGLLTLTLQEKGYKIREEPLNSLLFPLAKFQKVHPWLDHLVNIGEFFFGLDRGDPVGLSLAAVPFGTPARNVVRSSRVLKTGLDHLDEAKRAMREALEASAVKMGFREIGAGEAAALAFKSAGYNWRKLEPEQGQFIKDLALQIIRNDSANVITSKWGLGGKQVMLARYELMQIIVGPGQNLVSIGRSRSRVLFFREMLNRKIISREAVLKGFKVGKVTSFHPTPQQRRALISAFMGEAAETAGPAMGISADRLNKLRTLCYRELGASDSISALLKCLKSNLISPDEIGLARNLIPNGLPTTARFDLLTDAEKDILRKFKSLGDVEAMSVEHMVRQVRLKESSEILENSVRAVATARQNALGKLGLRSASGIAATPRISALFRSISNKLYGSPKTDNLFELLSKKDISSELAAALE